MSKMNSVKHLSDSAPQLEIVSRLRDLESNLQHLDQLPDQIDQVLGIFETMTQAQRQALDEMTQQQTQQLQGTIRGLADNLNKMSQSADRMHMVPEQMSQLIKRLNHAATTLERPDGPSLWTLFLALTLAGILGAGVALTGQHAFARLVPPDAVRQSADWATAVWSKATPQERELMQRIVNRPAN